MKKTNAIRALEAQKIHFEVIVYDEGGEFHSAEDAAKLIGAPVESVYKTLVVLREAPRAKPLLVMIAAAHEIDLRLLAKSLGEKKLRMATKKEAEALTGGEIGGISALGLLNRGFDICIDSAAKGLEWIHLSGGTRGLDVKLRTEDAVRLTRAFWVQATAQGDGGEPETY